MYFVPQAQGESFGVGDNNQTIQPQSRVGSAIEHDPVRVCDSARLDHDLVRRRLAAKQFQQCNREVVHHTAADAPVGQTDGLAVVDGNEGSINVDAAKVIHQYGKTQAVVAAQ